MADKPISTSLQPSNSGNLMYFLFLNKWLLSYIMKRLVKPMKDEQIMSSH